MPHYSLNYEISQLNQFSSWDDSVCRGVSSRHHSVLRGFFSTVGWLNYRFLLGTSLVTSLPVFWGFRSQTSSGMSTRLSTCLSWHSSSPSSTTEPWPQISTGSLWQLVSQTNLPGLFSTYLVVQDDSYTVHCKPFHVGSITFSLWFYWPPGERWSGNSSQSFPPVVLDWIEWIGLGLLTQCPLFHPW